jgi:hypothetical protein
MEHIIACNLARLREKICSVDIIISGQSPFLISRPLCDIPRDGIALNALNKGRIKTVRFFNIGTRDSKLEADS